MTKATVRIKIKGAKGSGKTVLLHVIGTALKTLGYNTECVDDGHEVAVRDVISPCLRNHVPDQRLIRVTTHEHNVKVRGAASAASQRSEAERS